MDRKYYCMLLEPIYPMIEYRIHFEIRMADPAAEPQKHKLYLLSEPES